MKQDIETQYVVACRSHCLALHKLNLRLNTLLLVSRKEIIPYAALCKHLVDIFES